jgi:branched-chain amino acid transport system permease protein
MVTISFQQILTLVLTNWIGLTHGPDGVRSIPRPAGLTSGEAYLSVCIVAVVAATLYAWRLKTSRLGRAMQAVRDNELAAGTCGIDVFATKVAAFGISAVLGGIGGGLFAGAFSYISPDQFTFAESIVLLTMALLGGVQSPFGALLGTGLLVMLPEWLRFLRQVYLAVYGGAVVLIMVFLPDGLWGFAAKRFRRADRSIAGDVAPLPLLGEVGTATAEVVLQIAGLAKYFGGLKALDGVDMAVRRGTVHALIGPNGSGKSTFINVLTGLYKPTAGRISFCGADITALPPHRRSQAGLARTFQNIRVFRGMTVLENVMVGAERPGNDVARQPGPVVERALAALEFVGRRQDALRPVGELSYGHQRHVEIARALAGSPQTLLLDEPAAGLNMTEKAELGELLRRLKGHGLTILIVDHDMHLVESVADHITVLNFGRRIADGLPRDVLRHPDVIAAYLGAAPDQGAPEPDRHEAA